jgi:signal peptidase
MAGSAVTAGGAHTARRRRIRVPAVRRVLGRAFTIAFFAAVAAWAVLLSPSFVGGPASYVLVSGESMEPLLSSGDVAIARERSSYAAGDIVAYRVPKGEAGAGAIVIHRIVGGDASGYVLKGDNRTGEDLWRPTEGDVLGEMWFSVPRAGFYLLKLRSPLALASLGALFAFFLVVTAKPRRRATAR